MRFRPLLGPVIIGALIFYDSIRRFDAHVDTRLDLKNIAGLIAAKRDGATLESSEIEGLIGGYAKGNVPDYQMAAFAMAVFFRGMTLEETTSLTKAMLNSGVVLDWPAAGRPKVDKHSTGGIGDKISIPLAPILACCGADVPMISGRGLGPTGGTLDKLESIPGFRCDLSLREFRESTLEVGAVISGATEEITPADRKLYALRDVTATVPSVPLITASILSKKHAEGLDALVLDVKWGSGAFMKTLDDAKELADSLATVSNALGVTTSTLITNMNRPLGRMIGNANEIVESVELLRGEVDDDQLELTMALGARVLTDCGAAASRLEARKRMLAAIDSGMAMQKFEQMVAAQGGNLSELPELELATPLVAERDGFVGHIDGELIGMAIIELGGGRKKMDDAINHRVGIEMLSSVGDSVAQGTPLCNIFSDNENEVARQMIRSAIILEDDAPAAGSLIELERTPGRMNHEQD